MSFRTKLHALGRVPQLALPRGPGAGQFAGRLQQGQRRRVGRAAALPAAQAEGGFGDGEAVP